MKESQKNGERKLQRQINEKKTILKIDREIV